MTIALTRPLFRTIAATVPRTRLIARSGVRLPAVVGAAAVQGFTPGAPLSAAYRDGCWCWFANPRAVHHAGAQDRTYFAVSESDGDITIYQWDHGTDTVTSFVLHAALEVDDHANPSIWVRPDGRLLLTYSKHVDPTIRQRLSTNPEDISAWGAETSLDAQLGGGSYTYSHPAHLTGEANSPLYLFYRQRDTVAWQGIWRTKSLNQGATWSVGENIFRNGTAVIYMHLVQNGADRIDFVVTDGHPDEEMPNGLYHVYYQGGSYYRSDGTPIPGPLPMLPSAGTAIHPGTPYAAWMWDICIDEQGYPIVAYDEIRSGMDHRYHYARWTGSGWHDNEVAQGGRSLYAGEYTYGGGMAIDRLEPNVLYLSIENGGAHELWRYRTDHGGVTWARTQLTDGSVYSNARPVSPRNAHPDVRVLWWKGRYTNYMSYNTQMLSWPTPMR